MSRIIPPMGHFHYDSQLEVLTVRIGKLKVMRIFMREARDNKKCYDEYEIRMEKNV